MVMARIQLSELAVERLRPDQVKRIEVPDARVTGLYLVVQPLPSGAKSWAVRGRLDDRPVKITIGDWPALDLKTARTRAGEIRDMLAAGRDPRQERAAALAAEAERRRETVGSILDQFEKRHAAKLKSGREAMRLLRRELGNDWDEKGNSIGPGWLNRSVHSISRKDVLAVLDAAVDRGSATLANRALAHIRKLFNWTVERGIIAPTANPVAGIKPPSREKSRDRTLSDDELLAVWKAAGRMAYPFGPAIRLLIATGQRREEVGQLEWREVDLDAAIWTMPAARNKGGRQHVVPLSRLALEVLEPLPRVGTHVFTVTGSTAVSGWSKAKAILDREVARDRGEPLAPWVLHDLRRTCASGLVRLGTRPDVVEATLGHAHPGGSQLASIYQRHGYLPEMRDALDRWADHVGSLGKPPECNVVQLRRK
jgi:integrase